MGLAHISTRSKASQRLSNPDNYKTIMSHLSASVSNSKSHGITKPYSSLSQREERECRGHNACPSAESTRRYSRGLIVDCLSILVSIAVLVFAVLGYRARGNVIDARERAMIDVARIVWINLLLLCLPPLISSSRLLLLIPTLSP
jgi:hypothetical protein